MDDCYPLAFGVPAITILISFIIFMCGSSVYVTKPANGNMFVTVNRLYFCNIDSGLSMRSELLDLLNSRTHWL